MGLPVKREGTIGAATVLAIAAVVGVSLQSGPKQTGSDRGNQPVETKRQSSSIKKNDTRKERPGCSGVQGELESFLAIEYIPAPDECFDPDETHGGNPPAELKEKTSELKFIIALLPDPAHTHASVLFDQFTTSIQEGAQDEKFDFHSSWLPWDHDESSYPLLVDQKTARREKEFEENQPGIVLFRKSVVCSDDDAQADCKKQASTSYSKGLIVFV